VPADRSAAAVSAAVVRAEAALVVVLFAAPQAMSREVPLRALVSVWPEPEAQVPARQWQMPTVLSAERLAEEFPLRMSQLLMAGLVLEKVLKAAQ